MFFTPAVPSITPEEARDKLQSGDLTIIDVRDQYEIDAASIEGSIYIHMSQIPSRLEEIPRDITVGILCRSGNRSGKVTAYLHQQGIKNVVNIEGGIKKWKQTVDPSLNPV